MTPATAMTEAGCIVGSRVLVTVRLGGDRLVLQPSARVVQRRLAFVRQSQAAMANHESVVFQLLQSMEDCLVPTWSLAVIHPVSGAEPLSEMERDLLECSALRRRLTRVAQGDQRAIEPEALLSHIRTLSALQTKNNKTHIAIYIG